ncbi:MAG: DUF4912 domain-containing protein [Desulfobacterota bacterium]|nr:DUF4912 domain-containing protein [Thermodesulfobacteriota bacterium]
MKRPRRTYRTHTTIQKRTPIHPAVQRITAAQLRRISRQLAANFPAAVDDETVRLVLLDVEPFKLHVYWNIPLRYLAALPTGEKRLRVYQLPEERALLEDALIWFDVPVQGLRSQRYIGVTHSGAAYAVEFGIVSADGRFYPVAASNTVRTPPSPRAVQQHTTLPKKPPVYRRTKTISDVPGEFTALTIGKRPAERPSRKALRPAVLIDEDAIDALVRQRLGMQHNPLMDHGIRPVPAVQSTHHFSVNDRPSSLSLYQGMAPQQGFSAELVVEGRIRPGLRLYVGGREVVPDVDGSFRLRRQLRKDVVLGILLNEYGGNAAADDTPLQGMAGTQPGATEKIAFEMVASIHLYGTMADMEQAGIAVPDAVTLPDGRLYAKRIVPRTAWMMPELIITVPAPEGIS